MLHLWSHILNYLYSLCMQQGMLLCHSWGEEEEEEEA
jgi:hypothetical protein